MKRNFLFQQGASNKFWTIVVEGKVLTTTYGRIGSAGSATSKEFESEEACEQEAAKLIKEKTKKGYIEGILDANSAGGILSKEEFWNLIERARKNSSGDIDEQASIITSMLAKRTVDDILEFGRIFESYHNKSYTSELWAAAYIIQGGCSDDGFDYFRGWLISRGKDVFEKALDDPASLGRSITVDQASEIDGECMLGIASSAYEEKTSKDDYYEMLGATDPRLEIQMTWTEEREDLEKLFPTLVKKFWTE